jgi:hypothetical protein
MRSVQLSLQSSNSFDNGVYPGIKSHGDTKPTPIRSGVMIEKEHGGRIGPLLPISAFVFMRN